MLKYEEDIEKLQTEVEKAREGPSNIQSFLGTGELTETKKKLSDKDKQIESYSNAFLNQSKNSYN